MSGKEGLQKVRFLLERYKYVFLVLLVGLVFLLWPSGEQERGTTSDVVTGSTALETARLERKLEQALSQVEGAGTVTVVLTPEAGPRRVLAQDADDREDGEEVERKTSVVLASQGSGTQEAVSVQQLAPRYRGALVVSSGAAQPEVKLALTQAVSALTGLGADKISICQGK